MIGFESILRDARIAGHEPLLYAVTPPRVTTPPERVAQLAERTVERLSAMSADGLVIYDLVDEADRSEAERPFPFLQTRDPAEYLEHWLGDWQGPSIVYRCVGKYDESELQTWMLAQPRSVGAVFVGAASAGTPVRTDLRAAQRLRAEVRRDLPIGGVAIPERHSVRGDEHARLLRKQAAGCTYFVSQVVYDLGGAKDLASDYAYACREARVPPVPVFFTLSLCGSAKTLDFLHWLGVDIPRWMRNEMLHADDTLEASLAFCLQTARELAEFCRYLRLPFGFNVESVSTRRDEIEATVDLAVAVREIIREPQPPRPRLRTHTAGR
ncbi:MAG TPA: 5,10-methylenetetrahydrofolate reductase [Phycicoccus sp.]|jgi:hypothetical protein|nr:5,10-methylenetetrahydrofolate reductase [Phycicoccus sp.]HQK30928.1 5,10-methylenetetrahydrofolate reductase [Phycicoccus sp.]HQY96017.1 5,10-methylenetetrahydrofolate reductase [Phycicoccus sp.]HRA44072.1 5,10-methylenetetrahydrofolate reductase [Phycicoccus sp.]